MSLDAEIFLRTLETRASGRVSRIRACLRLWPMERLLSPAEAQRFEDAEFALAAELIDQAVECDGRKYAGVFRDGRGRVVPLATEATLFPVEGI